MLTYSLHAVSQYQYRSFLFGQRKFHLYFSCRYNHILSTLDSTKDLKVHTGA